MDSNVNYQEDVSLNSSGEEVDQDSDDLGVGRSYECVFCKRGFNTAQALGGHMNIHRKDRGGGSARNKSTSTKQEHLHTAPRISSSDHHYATHINPPAASCFESQFGYAAAYVPAASSTSSIRQPTALYGNYHSDRDDHHHQPLNHPLAPPAGNWRLSLEFARTRNREELEEDATRKQELDLELRLGYDYS